MQEERKWAVAVGAATSEGVPVPLWGEEGWKGGGGGSPPSEGCVGARRLACSRPPMPTSAPESNHVLGLPALTGAFKVLTQRSYNGPIS